MMRLGQTSIIVFLSKAVGSALGFAATVYFARVLGAEVIGIYAVIISLVAWLQMFGEMGVGKAIEKRLSEGEQVGAYLGAGLLTTIVLCLGILVVVFVTQGPLEMYIGNLGQYTSIHVAWFIAALIPIHLFYQIVLFILRGERRVHLTGLLQPINISLFSILQITFVYLQYSLEGMIFGNLIGVFIIAVVGSTMTSVKPSIPDKTHFKRIIDFAKFSWLGGLKSRAFNHVDILLLGAFVSQSLVGVYSVAWSLAKFLDLFSNAISQSVFPEMSKLSMKQSNHAAATLLEDALAYAGLIIFPGFVGGSILSERLFRVYNTEFIRGTEVLWLLLLSILFHTYMQQLINGLNAIDRPNVAFRVNIVFIIVNVVLNIILITQFGWVGAAVASLIASLIGVTLSYALAVKIMHVNFPWSEISKQLLAAVVMGGVVLFFNSTIESLTQFQHNLIIVAILVSIGAVSYVSILYAISIEFRNIVSRNIPLDIITN